MKRKAMLMWLKRLGIVFVLGLGFFILSIGSEAKTNDSDVISIEVKKMVINEAPIEVKANEVEEVIEEYTDNYILYDIGLSEEEQKHMQDVCNETGVNYEFALALMKSESNFKWVEGDKNLLHHAIGYFQISTINEERMDKQYSLDIHDRLDNIEAGIRIIAELQDKFVDGYKGYFDTETAVVMCYKCGEGRGKELMADGIILKAVDVIKTDMEAFK